MIVVNAGVLIALLDAADAHHEAAALMFTSHIGDEIVIGPINLAEVLVRPARNGRDEAVLSDIQALGVRVLPLPGDAPLRLARLRAETGAKMPDCCVLLTAEQAGAAVASFDERVRSAATSRGMTVV